MPKFDIREQQSIMDPRRISPEQTGAQVARGLQRAGAAITGASKELERIQERDRQIELNKDLNQLTVQMAENENALEEQYPDGEGMSDGFDDIFTESTEKFRQKYRGSEEAEQQLSNMYTRFKVRAVNKQATFRAQAQVNSFREGRDITVNKVAKGELDFDVALDSLNRWTESLAGINPNARGSILQENQDMLGYAFVSNVLQDEGFIEADELVDSKDMEILSAGTRNSLKNKIKSEAGVYVRRQTRRSGGLFAAGYPVGALDEEIETAKRFGYDDQALQMETIQTLQGEVNEFVKQPSKKMRDELRMLDRKMLAGEISDMDLSRLNAYRSALNTKTKMLGGGDSYIWLDRSGYLGRPVQTGDPTGDMSLIFEDRRAIQAQVMDREGIRIPLLQTEEVAQFTSAISQSNPEQQVGLVNNLTQQLEGNEIGYTANQIAPKDPTLAVAMINAPFAPDVTRDILLGRSRDVPMADDTIYQQEFMDTYGTAIEDEGARQQALAAIMAAEKEYKFRNNESQKTGVSREFKKIAQRVIGPPISIGSNKTLSFRDESGNYVEEDILENLTDDLTEEDFMAVQGDVPRSRTGRPLDLDKMFDNMQIISIGDGLYAARNNNMEFAVNEAEEPFEIDLRALLQHERNKPMEITGSRRRQR